MSNEVIILDSLLEKEKESLAPSFSDSDFFEIFCFEQIVKNYDLSYDELKNCQIDGGDDGGIDGCFVFLNGELLEEIRNPK